MRFLGNEYWPACTGVVRSVNPTYKFAGDPDWDGDVEPLPVGTNDQSQWLVVIEADAPAGFLARLRQWMKWPRAEDGKYYVVAALTELRPL